MADQAFECVKLRGLTMVASLSLVSPANRFGYRYTEYAIGEAMDITIQRYGVPRTIRVDDGLGFVSKEGDSWAYMGGVTLDFSRSEKPANNAFSEACNAGVRRGCLCQDCFL